MTTSEDYQPMISHMLASHAKPEGPIIREIKALFMTTKKTRGKPGKISTHCSGGSDGKLMRNP